jgi:hypothetical protein
MDEAWHEHPPQPRMKMRQSELLMRIIDNAQLIADVRAGNSACQSPWCILHTPGLLQNYKVCFKRPQMLETVLSR